MGAGDDNRFEVLATGLLDGGGGEAAGRFVECPMCSRGRFVRGSRGKLGAESFGGWGTTGFGIFLTAAAATRGLFSTRCSG